MNLGRLFLAALALCCQAPPSGYSDLHASPLHLLVNEGSPTPVCNPTAVADARAHAIVLSLGQHAWPLGSGRALTPDDVPAAFQRAARRFDAPLPARVRWVGAVEGGSLLRADADFLTRLFSVGVRVVGLGHTHHDQFVGPPGDLEIPGPSEVDDTSRLTERGKRLVRLLRDSRLQVDLAHLGRAAFDDVVSILGDQAPLLVSHTAARALCDHPRNITDAQARRVARSGGLIGVVFHGPWLRCDRRPATIADVAEHIEHLVKVMGPTHVALGTDWDGRTRPPPRLSRPSELGRLESALLQRGMPRALVDAVLYRNVARWMAGLPARRRRP